MSVPSTTSPTIDSFRWDPSGWTPAEDTPQRRLWRDAAGDETMQTFGASAPRGLPADWKDAEALRRAVGAGTPPNIAFVSIDVVKLPAGVLAAKYIHKEFLVGRRGMMYVGMLSLPFESFFSNLIVACSERGTTGMREARLMAMGKIPLPKIEGPLPTMTKEDLEKMARGENRPVGPKRMASDDEQWDELFPDHPLSRVRAYLRKIEGSLAVDDSVRAALPFGG